MDYFLQVWTIDGRSGTISVGDLNDGRDSDRHFVRANTLYHDYGLTREFKINEPSNQHLGREDGPGNVPETLISPTKR
jgi:hypothetical protein